MANVLKKKKKTRRKNGQDDVTMEKEREVGGYKGRQEGKTRDKKKRYIKTHINRQNKKKEKKIKP